MASFLSFFVLFSLSYWKNVLQLGKNDDVHVNHTLSSNLDFLYKTEGKIQVVIRGEQIRLFTFLADRAELTLTSPQLWLLLKIAKLSLPRPGIEPGTIRV